MGKKKKLILFSWVLLMIPVLFLPQWTAWRVFQELKSRADFRIEGDFSPRWPAPAFDLRRVRLDWDRKIRVLEGDLRIEFDPFLFWRKRWIRVRLSGEKIPATVLEKGWVPQDLEKVTFDRIYAELLFDLDGLRDILALKVESPRVAFQFGAVPESRSADSDKKEESV